MHINMSNFSMRNTYQFSLRTYININLYIIICELLTLTFQYHQIKNSYFFLNYVNMLGVYFCFGDLKMLNVGHISKMLGICCSRFREKIESFKFLVWRLKAWWIDAIDIHTVPRGSCEIYLFYPPKTQTQTQTWSVSECMHG